MKNSVIKGLAILIAMTFSSFAGAEVTAIIGGTVHTVAAAGTIEGATILIEDGKITAVGANVTVPDGARRVDATGMVITPGLIDALSRLGLVEIGQAKGSVDFSLEDYDLGPAFAVYYGINPDSTVIPVTRIEGITRAVVAPAVAVDIFAGQGAAIHLGTGPDLVVDPSVAVFAAVGASGGRHTGGSRAAALSRLRQALEEARYYDAHREGYDAGAHRTYLYGRADLEALVPVIKGTKPLAVYANRASDIRHLLAIAGEQSVRLVLISAVEGWRVAAEIAAANVPVILSPARNLPNSFDGLAATLENAAKLHAAGVTIAIGSEAGGFGGTHNARLITQLAGIAVAYGLPWDAALRALTVNGATIWGLDNSVGTIEAGKDADIVVWNGDPLELTSQPQHVIIRGEEIPLVSRQTRLRDRYMHLEQKQPPFAYR